MERGKEGEGERIERGKERTKGKKMNNMAQKMCMSLFFFESQAAQLVPPSKK